MFCQSCGSVRSESADFCEKCGVDCRRTDSKSLPENTNGPNIDRPALSRPLTFEQYIKKKSDAESFCGMAKRKRDDRAAAIGTSAKRKKKDETVKVPPETTWDVIFTHQSQQCNYNAGNGVFTSRLLNLNKPIY